MLTYRRHRYATRWPRRLAFALAVLVLLVLGYRFYRAWQASLPQPPAAPTQVA